MVMVMVVFKFACVPIFCQLPRISLGNFARNLTLSVLDFCAVVFVVVIRCPIIGGIFGSFSSLILAAFLVSTYCRIYLTWFTSFINGTGDLQGISLELIFFYFFSSLARKLYSHQCWWQNFCIYRTF